MLKQEMKNKQLTIYGLSKGEEEKVESLLMKMNYWGFRLKYKMKYKI